MMAGEEAIRDVIAFPKNANAVDLMTNAPSPVDPEQLADLHIGLPRDGGTKQARDKLIAVYPCESGAAW